MSPRAWFNRWRRRIVHGLRNARYGQIGARPDAFWTCRYNEKQLQLMGPTVVTLDLSEAFGGANRIPDNDPDLSRVIASIQHGLGAAPKRLGFVRVPTQGLLRIAVGKLFRTHQREHPPSSQ